MPKAYYNYHGESACPYHRLLLPGRFCIDAVEKAGWGIDIGEGMPPGYDCYFFHGLPNEVALIEFARIKRRKATLVWSLDDDWLSIPDWNPAKPPELGMAMYEAAKGMADWIVTSTPHLQSTFGDVADKVLYAPNLLDCTLFPEVSARVVRTEENGDTQKEYDFRVTLPVKVFWAGGPTHKEDTAILERPLHRLLERYDPSKVSVIFQGAPPPSSLMLKYLHRGILHYQMTPFQKYQQTVNMIGPHVCLAPLAEVDFNLSKSNLRVMEGWALNAAVVATDWGEYSHIKNGVDGRLVQTEDQWFHALDRLVRDHEYRLNMAILGYERVNRFYNWNVEECRKPWYKLYSRIFGVDVRGNLRDEPEPARTVEKEVLTV